MLLLSREINEKERNAHIISWKMRRALGSNILIRSRTGRFVNVVINGLLISGGCDFTYLFLLVI